jgi:hypothetical protein
MNPSQHTWQIMTDKTEYLIEHMVENVHPFCSFYSCEKKTGYKCYKISTAQRITQDRLPQLKECSAFRWPLQWHEQGMCIVISRKIFYSSPPFFVEAVFFGFGDLLEAVLVRISLIY